MKRKELAEKFVDALKRQIEEKSFFADGVETALESEKILINIAEELGEASSDFLRGRMYGAVSECVDIAHSAMLLAISLDKDGEVLNRHYKGL